MKKNTKQPSPEVQAEAISIANSTQKPGQTKEQTKAIARGIEKGIALYKKQQKEKNRQLNRAKKKQRTTSKTVASEQAAAYDTPTTASQTTTHSARLPWLLLIASWLGFIIYLANQG